MDQSLNLKPSDKICISIKEAAEYSGIGEYRLKNIIKDREDELSWVVFIGNSTKIRRKEFEDWFAAQKSV